MTERSWKVFTVLLIAGSAVTVFIDWTLTTGWILGCLISRLLYRRIEIFWNGILDQGYSTAKTGRGNRAGNIMIMAGVLVICAVCPQYLNIFACALGMMAIKITSVIDVLIPGKEKL